MTRRVQSSCEVNGGENAALERGSDAQGLQSGVERRKFCGLTRETRERQKETNVLRTIDVKRGITLADYAANAHLQSAALALQSDAAALVSALRGRKVWMVNSTARGGGVAEMLPRLVSVLRQLGVDVEWLVIATRRHEFFRLTKRIHNALHGADAADFSAADQELFAAVSGELADELSQRVAPEDIVIVHDPQPLGLGALIEDRVNPVTIWRCHVGIDRSTRETQAAWEFLRPWAERYDHAVFSAAAYIPSYLTGNATIIHPAIDPLSHKNRELSATKMTGILCNAGLLPEYAPVLTPAWSHRVQRLQADGSFADAVDGDHIGLMFRPTVTQISRWDRLKGWQPLLEGFAELKRRLRDDKVHLGARQRRRLQIMRLVLAGPDPQSVQDDPEAPAVLDELRAAYVALPPDLQRDVALLSLPMQSLKFNALTVNALQRASSVVVQNSIQEGFGLVVTEAMWKRAAVVGSRATGIREQIRDGVDGRIVDRPDDPACIAEVLSSILSDSHRRDAMGRNAQRKVYMEFLIFAQVRRWLDLMSSLLGGFKPRRAAR